MALTSLSVLHLPALLPCQGPEEGYAGLLPPQGMEKAKGQAPEASSSFQSFKISFTQQKWLHEMEKPDMIADGRGAGSRMPSTGQLRGRWLQVPRQVRAWGPHQALQQEFWGKAL